ncbi:MAG: hypothetical protein A2Y62_01125 [Candidatus Fischerbacteria bacterium RBG_13_37_8]|uniref:Membrane protein 6-pyruvoyl-tetrahydropterin synthase-related domain-containing protein n=1 Tax=Candidatus Fischerbacteria bacterium RBG_13_37_8 TaxID=1817863 RepID=A0A1F5VXF2_9BACT|nr:MAG: hypothetical protein A2Y62_01125 [Candidatus Fischerbacteria bacterium RBG_13_37_8]
MLKKEIIIGLLILLGITLIYDLRITFNQGLVITDDGFISDLMNDRYPARVTLSRELKQGNFPLWTPLIYTGFPIQENPEAGITYPINLLLFGLFPPALAFNLSLLIKFFLAGAFLFLYLRLINVNLWASIFGAIAFSWCGFFVAHLKHLNTHDAGIWIPLILIFLEKYHQVHKIHWLALASLILGVQFLAGHPQISYYTMLFAIAFFLWQELPQNKRLTGITKLAGILALFLILGVGIGMLQLFPTFELTQFSERGGGVSYQFATQYPYYLPDLLTFIYPYINGDPGNATYKVHGVFWEDYGYVGLLPLFFAFYAMFATFRKNRHTRFFTIAFIICLILMLGDQAILYKILFHIVPGMNYFRFSTRFILFVDLSLAILAAIGLANMLKNKTYLVYLLIIALATGDLFYMQKRQNPVVSRDKWETLPRTAEIIQQDKSLFRILSIGGIETHSATYTLASGWQGDLTPYIQQREMLQPSLNMMFNISSADGYMNLAPKHVIDMWGNEKQLGYVHQTARLSPDGQALQTTWAFSNIINAFNIKYLISPWTIVNPDLQLIASPLGFLVYLNSKALPRSYLVRGAVHLPDNEAAQALISGQIILPDTVIITDEEVSPQEKLPIYYNPGTVNILSYTADKIILEANASRDCWLVLSDTYYPRWRATIDDRETTIHRANICARAIRLPAGSHKVIFSYHPSTFYVGLIITLLSLAATLLLVIRGTRDWGLGTGD